MDTPFPFPWAQCVTIVLATYTAFTPFLIAGFTTSTALAVLMTFASVHTMIMLNEVARAPQPPSPLHLCAVRDLALGRVPRGSASAALTLQAKAHQVHDPAQLCSSKPISVVEERALRTLTMPRRRLPPVCVAIIKHCGNGSSDPIH